MKLHLDQSEGIHIIQSYDQEGVVVNERRYSNSLIISPGRIDDDWRAGAEVELNETLCEPILNHGPEIVLLGTGTRFRTMDQRLLVWFGNQGIGLEVMDTGAAARTYNILASEQRNVAAALIF